MSLQLKPVSFLFALGISIYAIIPIVWVAYLTITSNTFITNSPFAPDAGIRQSIPNDLLTMGDLANRHHLKTYHVSKELDDFGLYKMRSIEYLYPAKYDPQSRALFTVAHAKTKSACKLIAIQGNIALYDCP